MHVLLVEDDPALRISVTRALSRRGMQIDCAADGGEALQQWSAGRHEVVVLDLSLPDIDGLDVLVRARKRGWSTPVLLLTARGTVGDRVLGLNAGADDYLPKPFDLDELEARLKALVRRRAPGGSEAADSLKFGTKNGSRADGAYSLRYENRSGAILWNNQPMDLTPRELALLKALLAQAGHAVAKERLFELVFAGDCDVQSDAIEVVVYRLRKKLAATGATLMTLRGLGYLLKVPA